jgi:hypothetical protein
MKTPSEILLRQHQAASSKLDAIRAEVVAGIARAPAPETMSWGEMVRSLRWHLAALGAAWVVVMMLNIGHSTSAVAMIPRAKIPAPQQIWASLREHRRLLLEYSGAAAVETSALPGRRSEINPQQMVV